MRNPFLAFLILSTATSCAFKKSAPQAATVEAAAQEVPAPSGVSPQLSVSWAATRAQESGTALRTGTNTPLVIPASVPNELGFELTLENAESVSGVSIEGFLGTQGGVPYPLEVKSLETEGSKVVFRAAGFSKLMPSNEETLLTVRATFKSERGAPQSATIQIITPPSKIALDQKPVTDFETAGGVIPAGSKRLATVDSTFSLLQVVSAKNGSPFPHEYAVPVRLEGRLSARYQRSDVTRNLCTHSIATSSGETSYSENLWLVPLSTEIAKSFAIQASQALSNGHWTFTVSPGETALLGIYAVGAEAEKLMAQGHELSSFVISQAPTGCRASCLDANGTHWDGNRTAFAYWDSRGWPGVSKVCESIKPWASARWWLDAHQTEQNICAEWDLSISSNPTDPRRYCRTESPSAESWRLNQTFVPVQEGVQTEPVLLTLLPGTTGARVRFAFPGLAEQGEAREIPGLLQSHTKQAD